jgi:hypothetical protein
MAEKLWLLRRVGVPTGRWGRAKSWPADERGSAAIEAAIILPLLVLIFLGMVEMSQAFTVKRRVQNVASSTADLVAQFETVTTSDLNDIASIGAQLMLPFSSTGLTLMIASVAEDAQSKITVQWSCSCELHSNWSRLYRASFRASQPRPERDHRTDDIPLYTVNRRIPEGRPDLHGIFVLYITGRASLLRW